MARETVYLVQAFKAGTGARVDAETSIRCKSSDTACRAAEHLATTKAGVTFAKSGDSELGGHDDEFTIIFEAGRLPAPFEEA